MKIVLYKDKKGEFRWKLVARNGRILADSAEGYKRKKTMMHTVGKILQWEYWWDHPTISTTIVVDKTGVV